MRCVLHQIAQLSSSQLSSVQHDSTSFIKLEDITVPNIFIYDVVVRILEDNVCSVTQNMLSKYAIKICYHVDAEPVAPGLACFTRSHSPSFARWLAHSLSPWLGCLPCSPTGWGSVVEGCRGWRSRGRARERCHEGAASSIRRITLDYTVLYYTIQQPPSYPISHAHARILTRNAETPTSASGVPGCDAGAGDRFRR